MKYGLALAGGGARGAAHVGVLAALAEEGLLPDRIAGASAGGIVAGLYAAGMAIGDMQALVEDLTQTGDAYLDPDIWGAIFLLPQALLWREISLSGLIKGKHLLQLFCSLTNGMDIRDAAVDLVIPAVDLRTGDTVAFTNMEGPGYMEDLVWERSGQLCQIMMASAAVPAVFCPRRIGKYCLVDGGVTNNLPVDLLIAAGEPYVIAVDIGIDYKAPHDHGIVEIASHSFSIMSRSLKHCMSSGEMLLLKPELDQGAGLLSFGCMKTCMEEGYRHARRMMPRIKRVLRQKGVIS